VLATALASVWLVASAAAADASPGDLDPTFGTGGWATVPVGRSYSSVSEAVIQPDGRIVVAGLTDDHVARTRDDTFAAWRHLATGGIDGTFDGVGMASVDFSGPASGALAVDLQPNGNIVLAGYVGSRQANARAMAVGRLLPGGALDPSFGGGDGKVRIPIEGMTFAPATAVEVLSDDRILLGGPVAGPTYFEGSRYGTALVMLTPEGDLDVGFGVAGVVLEDREFRALTIDAAGDIVVAMRGPESGRFVVGRFHPDGAADSTFGGDGIRGYSAGYPTDVRVDAAGRILVSVGLSGGRCIFGSSVVARLTPDGSWDTSFSGDGKTPRECIYQQALAIQGDGRIVIVGSVFAGGGSGEFLPVVGRLNIDGSLDTTFGDGGFVTAVIVDGYWMYAMDVILQPDGKIVLLADSPYGDTYELGRFLPS
jgi:uncharacterized delta-60 repeat protein